jgi:hypothetical protein
MQFCCETGNTFQHAHFSGLNTTFTGDRIEEEEDDF